VIWTAPTIIGRTLPDPYYSTVESVRDDLVETFGVDEYVNPFPHFTLYPLDEGVDVSAVVTALEEVTEDQSPFPVHTDGIGLFPHYDFEWDFTVDNVTITRPPADGEQYEVLASIDL